MKSVTVQLFIAMSLFFQLNGKQRQKNLDFISDLTFCSHEITPAICQRMSYSWRNDCPIKLADLRLLKLFHWGYDGNIHQGELVVHKKVAEEVITIFKELLVQQFPIQRMKLIDEYKADDEKSMEANNTSAFCCRENTSSPGKFSKHSYGIAIDINPKVNPYVKGSLVLPLSGVAYIDRSQTDISGFITEDTVCYKVFSKYGWKWGGHFTHDVTDYHHFEKEWSIIL